MMKQVLTTTLMSLGIGYACQFAQSFGQNHLLNDFLKSNLITLLVALLAINSTTTGIVLTKIRDLIDKNGGGSEFFKSTKNEMLLSIKEQIVLIILSVALLTIGDVYFIKNTPELALGYSVIITGIFSYSMFILYDTAKSVIIIIDYE